VGIGIWLKKEKREKLEVPDALGKIRIIMSYYGRMRNDICTVDFSICILAMHFPYVNNSDL